MVAYNFGFIFSNYITKAKSSEELTLPRAFSKTPVDEMEAKYQSAPTEDSSTPAESSAAVVVIPEALPQSAISD